VASFAVFSTYIAFCLHNNLKSSLKRILEENKSLQNCSEIFISRKTINQGISFKGGCNAEIEQIHFFTNDNYASIKLQGFSSNKCGIISNICLTQ